MSPAAERHRLLVVGNGMAGARTVEEILGRDREKFDVTMIGDEPYGNYNRIMLSHVLSGESSIDDDDLMLNPMAWYRENGVTLHVGDRAVALDRFAKNVTCESGRVVPYDTVIIATGSTTFFPNMDGLREADGRLARGVFGFRTIEDTNGMLQMASSRDGIRAVVIGGGLLGLEAAYGLRTQGIDVDVVHSPGHLMNQQLDERGGRVLRNKIEDLGVGVYTSKRTTAVLRDESGAVTGVAFNDGPTLPADMIVVTAGIRPNVDLARRAGLVIERGIVVDDQMRCEDEGAIHAVGECCQHRGEVYGLVAPLWEQASVLADVLTGANPAAAYHGSRLTTKLKVAGVDVAAMGVKGPERDTDEFVQFYEPRSGTYKSVVVRDNKLIGAMLLGDISKVSFLTQAFDEKVPLPDERISMLFDMGTPSTETGAAELSDDVQVCNCNGVTKGDIVACVQGGATTVSEVVGKTRAGKGCGSCKGLVADIVACAAGGALAVDPAADWYVPCIPMSKPELIEAVRSQNLRSVSAVFDALADAEDATAKMPLASLLRVVWGPDWVDERGALFINDRVHANIQRDGTFSVVPQMKGGVTTPDQLRRIADVADKYGVPLVKVTGGQRIDLLGIKKEDLPKVWGDLDMPSGYAYGKSMRTVKTCVGSDFCRFGLGDSTALGIAIEERFQGLETPAKLKLAVAGCPRNCSEALCKDFGVVAVGDGRWEIYIGGAAGAHIRKGDVLATVDSPEEVLTLAGRFIQYYREEAKWLERTYAFVPRVGLETLQRLLVDDAEGLCAGLDERIQISIDGYTDPWKERAAPRSPAQFAPSLPLLPLPQVPVR
ncbi:NAD(P)/FAD-dependent oxidoreductase [Rhodococcus sp. BP-349]|uniref:nitrite reductase large subunit NirB n=1 Tax=unclassified Rhodococcus (in: high G+C Gram-positive bacteria) TaxID=192944 RepID=UPI001C9B62AD|nr:MULTISPECIES: nitrite reductase large subunit NirB [unclassified Rhodococcus (in: high G+C Gram-positive bacteria)]MBY6541244.1 NAD(P)/FAD-dependent oxidoreductase [Rhodococcus sp. BP-363]MBY6544730.1 NAD(P)/FAD-dependent oxidoreductase [Rhodococcus sp. BP-369]MBY6563960.1 NAD(P)/FAD-dependent oxidoreductase [Rhodococcus sp. BP-370]MBY6579103.1 NAD(P)/FAD-dependent oxidoreductase [Rhodococcus sp. BP-364]MBY6588404.1 NAD(P)/FAD-dependent oxidoreductase [Rhodococcus sp. BP-358]